MKTLMLLITATGLVHGQPLGWTPLGNNTILTTAAAAGGLTGALVDCPTPSRPYCSGNTVSYTYLGSVRSVIQAQSGCATDTVNNLMVCTGGGHTDYWGNQVYVVDVVNATITRITDPSGPVNNSGQVNPDNTPPASHTQQGLVMLQSGNLFRWGIGVSNTALIQTAGWWFNMSTKLWTQKAALPTRSGDSGDNVIVDTSSVSESIIILSYLNNTIYRYDPSLDTGPGASPSPYTAMANPGSIIMINGGTCAVLPSAKKLYCAGKKQQGGGGPAGGVYTYSLANGSTYLATDITGTLTGCTGLYDISNPGFKLDTATQKFVKYSGTGNSVIVFDPVALSCSTQTFSNGPSNPVADTYGIYDLWTYFPLLGAFYILPNATDQMFKLIIDGVSPTITNPASDGPITGGTQNSAYSFTFAATGTTPMTWDITAGTPPTGVSINSSTGVLSGPSATVAGTFSFTIRATNGYGSPSTRNVSITIAPVCLINIPVAGLPAGKFNVPYSQTIPTAGCSSPSFAAVGSLPTGLTLHSGTGIIDGTPITPGNFPFTINVTDSAGLPTQPTSITIIPGPGVLNVLTVPGFISR